MYSTWNDIIWMLIIFWVISGVTRSAARRSTSRNNLRSLRGDTYARRLTAPARMLGSTQVYRSVGSLMGVSGTTYVNVTFQLSDGSTVELVLTPEQYASLGAREGLLTWQGHQMIDFGPLDAIEAQADRPFQGVEWTPDGQGTSSDPYAPDPEDQFRS